MQSMEEENKEDIATPSATSERENTMDVEKNNEAELETTAGAEAAAPSSSESTVLGKRKGAPNHHEQEQEQPELLTRPVKPKKPKSAWMIFLLENMERLKKSKDGYMNAAGVEWKEMDDESKKKYSDLAAEFKAAYEKEKEEYNAKMEEYVAKGGSREIKSKSSSASSSIHGDLPLGRIKRLVNMDPEIKRMAKTSYMLVAKATECFIGHLAKSTHRTMMRTRKGKTIRLRELCATIHRERLYEFLNCDFSIPDPTAEPKAKKANNAKKAERLASTTIAPSITNFFGAGSSSSSSTANESPQTTEESASKTVGEEASVGSAENGASKAADPVHSEKTALVAPGHASELAGESVC